MNSHEGGRVDKKKGIKRKKERKRENSSR